MTTFVLEEMEEVPKGKLHFHKLVINGSSLFDEFAQEVLSNAQDTKSLNVIRAYMCYMAERDAQLPKTKFNSIKERGSVVGYEFKSGLLRVYVVKQEPNVYVVMGGYKSNQKKDIVKFGKYVTRLKEYNNKLKEEK
jgi:hypothetical protein